MFLPFLSFIAAFRCLREAAAIYSNDLADLDEREKAQERAREGVQEGQGRAQTEAQGQGQGYGGPVRNESAVSQ